MAKSNWYGSSGWTAINDPTGVLDGRCLVVAAGTSAIAQDYLTQVVGTSTTFSTIHYAASMDYAVFQSADVTNMTFGVIARAGNFGGVPSLARNCYRGVIDVGNQTATIYRRYGGSDTVLTSAGLTNSTAYTVGTKHNISLTAVGVTTVNLSLKVDGSEIISIGDTGTQKLTSGYPGIYSESGTVYADNFGVVEYTSTGESPASWTPSNLSAGVTLALWLKGDTGITLTGTSVSGWADQSGNGNNAAQPTSGNMPVVTSSDLNNYDVVTFDGTDDTMSIADSATIDMQGTGLSIFAMVNPLAVSGAGGFIAAKSATYDLILNSALEMAYSNGTAGVTSATSSFTTSNYQIFEVVSNDYMYIDGTALVDVSSVAIGADNANLLYLASGGGGSNFLEASFAEIIMVQGNVSAGDRQKIEGYLAQKYGTWPSLPSDHPYRTIAPTV